MSFIHQLDFQIFTFLNNFSRNASLDGLIFFLARYLVMVFLLVIIYLLIKKERAVFYVLTSAALAFFLDQFLAFFYVRQRPFVTHPEINHLALRTTIASFPSTHAIMLFAIIASLYFLKQKKLAVFLLIIGLIVVTARVAAGVHYPSDIAAGVIFGVLISWFVNVYRRSGLKNAK